MLTKRGPKICEVLRAEIVLVKIWFVLRIPFRDTFVPVIVDAASVLTFATV